MADTTTQNSGPGGGREPTNEELDNQARARQDVNQNPRFLAMQSISEANDQRIEEQLAAEGLTSASPVGEQDQRRPEPGPYDEPANVQTARREQDPPGEDESRQQQQRARAKAPTVDPQLLAQLGTEPLPAEALDGLRLRFKVNGQDRIVTVQELRREAQIDGAAQTRLEQANTLLAQAQEAVARLNGTQPGATQPPVGVEPKAGQGDSGGASQDVNAIAKDLVQSLFVGDEEAATATVVKLLAGLQQPGQVDAAALAQRVAPVLRQQQSQEEAEAQFRSDFKDIIADPILVGAADRFYAEAAQADPQKSYAELLTEAGTKTREWMTAVTGQKPATGQGTRSTREEKLQAKQRMDNVRGLNRTEGSQEEPVQTASQVIAEMRTARGLG